MVPSAERSLELGGVGYHRELCRLRTRVDSTLQFLKTGLSDLLRLGHSDIIMCSGDNGSLSAQLRVMQNRSSFLEHFTGELERLLLALTLSRSRQMPNAQ